MLMRLTSATLAIALSAGDLSISVEVGRVLNEHWTELL